MKRDDDDDDDCRSLILLCVNDDVTRVHFVQVTSKIFGVDFCFLDYNAVNVCCMFSVTFTRTVVWPCQCYSQHKYKYENPENYIPAVQ